MFLESTIADVSNIFVERTLRRCRGISIENLLEFYSDHCHDCDLEPACLAPHKSFEISMAFFEIDGKIHTTSTFYVNRTDTFSAKMFTGELTDKSLSLIDPTLENTDKITTKTQKDQ